MIKLTKNVVLLTLVFVITIGLASCTRKNNSSLGKNTNKGNNDSNIKYSETLRVYNASEYIDETTIADFEREYAIKIEYSEFESNEGMYNDVSLNSGVYDVLVPSDYTIDRLIKEDRLARLDKSIVSNIANVAEEYLKPAYDPDNNYVVPYMVGTLGILYNKSLVAAPVDSWTALFDPQYAGKVLMLDSERDSIGATLKMLGFSMNSNDDSELSLAKSMLQTARSLSCAYVESEEIRNRMVAGEGTLGVVYSGDAKTAIDRNPDLAYVIPQEGSNKWVDGFVIIKDTQHFDAAQKFINFMCRPNIAVRNMTNTGYTSPIKGAWSEFGGNKIMFPTTEELERCEAFLYDAQATQKYDRLWMEIR